jgi:hypothetical protein
MLYHLLMDVGIKVSTVVEVFKRKIKNLKIKKSLVSGKK